MSSIFGGSKSKSQSQSTQSSQSDSLSSSSSYNKAYDTLAAQYQPAVNQGNQAMSSLNALLGLGGDAGAAQTAYNDYLGSTDYGFTMNQGVKALTNAGLVNGSFGSGATAKALQSYGQNTAQKYFGDYLQRLLGIGSYGQQAGSLLANAGQVSNSMSKSNSLSTGQSTSLGTSSTNQGAASTIGSIASLVAASDRRLKTDIVLVGRDPHDGLGTYEWTYVWGGERVRGHMADEIESKRPWALGPTIGGYKTVDYAKA